MRRLATVVPLGIVLLDLAAPLAAQEPVALETGESSVEVRLSDGSVLYGRIVSVEGDRVTIRTAGGATVDVDRSQIVSVTSAGENRPASRERIPDRLFATPTGRTLPRGTGHAGVQELLFPYVSYGIVDRLQLTAGTTIVPEIFAQVWYVAPKVGIVATPNVHLSAGGVAVFILDEDLDGDDDRFGVLHASLTLGPAGRSATLAAGFPFLLEGEGGDFDFASKPLLLAGGEYRVGEAVSLITDNALVPGEDGALLSGGVRLMGERLSADLGVSLLVDQSDWTCCVPVVNVQWAFGDP